MAKPIDIKDVLGSSWDELSARVAELRNGLYGELPNIGPVDIASIEPPQDVLEAIRKKNRRRVRDEVSLDEMTAEGSPYRTHAYFDDQLLEVIVAEEERYEPIDFVRQMVLFIEKFITESAAFRAGGVAARVAGDTANGAIDCIREAIERASDPDTRRTLELLLVDFANGGEEPWAATLSARNGRFLKELVAKH